ncbi:D-amino-acid dehydrogenase [Sinorhizobium kostiense]|uniref:D-amino-acid dehydrogenase n=1 Tax=Sinorhizobium kostiense TaxID=76747 RepID=A0ABS4R158_9HYPH|nr:MULTISPECIES: D-amino acid dehydrogenase [Sinorhizobium]MBP2236634.1 D-amino-acid dehydrogenase [Sinorhizobium kostiense]
MPHLAIIGAGVTGITTAYSLLSRGYKVTVFDRHAYPAMETSFANGGQLSASNAEVWNHWSTLLKGVKWMLTKDAPLLINPKPSWSKYSWLAEFVTAIPNYKANTVNTARLAIQARQYMFDIAMREGIEFDFERRGILHFYRDEKSYRHASEVNALLKAAGLDRRSVTPSEIRTIEPTLTGDFYGGFYTPSDATGDIHKFTRGLADACIRKGASFQLEANVIGFQRQRIGLAVQWKPVNATAEIASGQPNEQAFDGLVICAGVASRHFAGMLGDRVNIYPVKGYSITIHLDDERSQEGAPWVSLLDDAAKIVTSRLGRDRFRVAGTAEINGVNYDIRADRITPLVRWTRHHFPQVNTSQVVPWSGLRPMMPNMLPRVGKGRQPHVFYNTGHGHLGWTLSCATAELLGEAVAGSLQAN